MPRKLPQAVFDFKAARKARGVSQQQAAILLHATQPSISRWESEGSMPEVYRMAWLLHWQLEDSKNATDTPAGKSARKSHRSKRKGARVEKTTARSRADVSGGMEEDARDDAATV